MNYVELVKLYFSTHTLGITLSINTYLLRFLYAQLIQLNIGYDLDFYESSQSGLSLNHKIQDPVRLIGTENFQF